MSADWRTDELEQERDGLRARVARWDAEVARLERLLGTAEAAFAEHCSRLREIGAAQATLRGQVAARGTTSGPDGRPMSGPTGGELGFYAGLSDARAQEEQRFAAWVNERRVPIANGPLATSWSPRCVSDVQASLADARRGRAVTGARLGRVEEQLEAATATAPSDSRGTPATDETRGLVERLRSRIGG